MRFIIIALLGTIFGLTLYKAEIISWYRIQAMFKFEEFHMYGVIGSAIITGALLLWISKKLKLRDSNGESFEVRKKDPRLSRAILGGILFGMGWALTGACPGPLLIHVGTGAWSFLIVFLMAIVGTALYGMIKDKLPH